MREKIGKGTLLEAIENIGQTIAEEKEELTKLDSKIGDGDHGVNLSSGFNSVLEDMDEFRGMDDIGAILESLGFKLIEATGGSVGVLYGSAVRAAGKPVEGKENLDLKDIGEMAEAAVKEVEKRGNVKVGEKTMLDTIHPFSEALKEAVEDEKSLEEALDYATKKAEEGMQKTKDMVAKKGRAKYFGEKTVGHKDVGAVSSYLIIKSAKDTLIAAYG